MEAGWPGTVVEEGNLTVQIAALRKALGSRPDGSEWIVTVPRVGYRLVRSEQTTQLPKPSSPLPSLAVLPFQNLSSDPEQDYFADGIVEDITTALSRFKSFAVIARNSSFVYKGRVVDVRQIAQELNVRYVLEGSVPRAAERLRIAAQLVDAATGAHLWAETFDGKLGDVFDFQDRITEQVAGIVQPTFEQAEMERSRRKRPDELGAYDLLLRARHLLYTKHISQNDEVVQLLTQAVALDPNFAPAVVELAFALDARIGMGWLPFSDEVRRRAISYANSAVLNAAGDSRVLGTASIVLMHCAKDYEQALQLARTAVENNPNSPNVMTSAAVIQLHCGDLVVSA